MLKWKRKLNKRWWIEASRRPSAVPPLPKAYAALLAAGVSPGLAGAMVRDASKRACVADATDLGCVVVWSNTPFFQEWADAHTEQQGWFV